MRLIDAEALKKEFPKDSDWEYPVNTNSYVCKTIDAQPTIEEHKTGLWIPCSERLPEESDYIGCSECIDGAVWYYTDKCTMGLGYYYNSTQAWSTTDDEKPYGNVIAWMPLPDPYKEDDESK